MLRVQNRIIRGACGIQARVFFVKKIQDLGLDRKVFVQGPAYGHIPGSVPREAVRPLQ